MRFCGRQSCSGETAGDAALAKKTYEDFLKRYRVRLGNARRKKRSRNWRCCRMATCRPRRTPVASNSTSARSRARARQRARWQVREQQGSVEIPRVRRIRASANGDATRVTIDLEDSVPIHFRTHRESDRIFFDLHAARLTPEVARGSIAVDGVLLTAVRVAQNHGGVVRVVLNVNGVKDYAASLGRQSAATA